MEQQIIEFGRVLPDGSIDVIFVTTREGEGDNKPLVNLQVCEPSWMELEE